MPTRNDLYTFGRQILLGAGIKTVFRGMVFPEEDAIPGSAYPIAAWVERSARLEVGNYSYVSKGEVDVWLFAESGDPAGTWGDQPGFKVLDDLYDNILGEHARAFINYHSQTMKLDILRIEPWPWYRSKGLPLAAGSVLIEYHLNQAFSGDV